MKKHKQINATNAVYKTTTNVRDLLFNQLGMPIYSSDFSFIWERVNSESTFNLLNIVRVDIKTIIGL